MKQSTFKKELSATGKNGTIKAEIIVTMNYSTKLSTGTHAVTHDDFAVNNPIHKVEAFVNGQLWGKVDELTSENMVLVDTEKLINKTNEHINRLANDEPVKNFVEKMNDLFSDFK